MPRLNRRELEVRDASDLLAPFRDAFHLPSGVVYLDGNSLGVLPKAAASRIDRTVRQEWGDDLIRSWNTHGWMDLPRRVGDKIARLVGAAPGEIAVADSTSVNLFKALTAAMQMRAGRTAIVTESGNFPTDLYVVQGLVSLLGDRHRLVTVAAEDVVAAIDDDTAVVMLTHVDYRSGRMHDMAAVTAAAHAKGALMLWDLSHSTGAVPVDLNGADADFAVGCGYKYLNGGPGAPAFIFAAARHHEAMRPAPSGWMGHAAPFEFDGTYRAAGGITRTMVGTPSVLALSALDAAIDVFQGVDMAALREKSLALTELFMALIRQECGEAAFDIITPADPARRGSQVAMRHPDGYAIVQALIARGVIGDFRAPDILRFGFTPLYLRYTDVWDAVALLRDIMETEAWKAPEFQVRAAVT